jgi:hypothetical protein
MHLLSIKLNADNAYFIVSGMGTSSPSVVDNEILLPDYYTYIYIYVCKFIYNKYMMQKIEVLPPVN